MIRLNRIIGTAALTLLNVWSVAWAIDGSVRHDAVSSTGAAYSEIAASYNDAAMAAAFGYDDTDAETQLAWEKDLPGGSTFIAIESADLSAESSDEIRIEYDTVHTRTLNTVYLEFNFRFDRYELDMNYMDNNTILRQLDRILDSIGIENITKLEILSQSSPEGVYEHNIWLSERRSETMGRFMNENYPELSGIMSTSPDGESWQMLRDYVSKDTRMEKVSVNKVIDVIDSDVNIGTKKWRMENALGSDANVGNIYKYLYRTYYPRIRFSGLTIDLYKDTVELVERQVVVKTEPVVEPDHTEEVPVIPVQPTHRRFPKLALKTNLAYDVFFTPDLGYAPILNVEYEYYFTENGHWSTVGEYEFPWWSDESKHQYLQMLNWQQEMRYYLKSGRWHTGHYLSLYGGYNLYDICFDSNLGNGYQGEGVHGGLGYGYVLPLNRKHTWKLEFFVKAGYYESHYDKYDAGVPFHGKYYYRWYQNPNDLVPRNWRFRWFGPTGAGITLSYDIIYRRKLNDTKAVDVLNK